MTTENNKLFAEFLGRSGKIKKNLYSWNGIDNLLSDYWVCAEDMKFHSNWEWLMQVIEKIETTSYNVPENLRRGFMKNTLKATGVINSSYDDRSEFLGWSSSAWLGTKTIFDSTMLGEDIERYNTKIEACYNACLGFIKWHNEQKNK
jgi:hypothetical protein